MDAEKLMAQLQKSSEAQVKPFLGKEKELKGVTLPLSPETSTISSQIMQDVLDDKDPNPTDVSAAAQSIAKDLQEEGVSFTEKEVENVAKDTTEKFGKEARKGSKETPESLLEGADQISEITVKEAKKTLDDVMKTYGLSAGKWGTIAGLLSGNEITATLLGGAQARETSDPKRVNKLFQKLTVASRMLKLHKTPVADMQSVITSLPEKKKKIAVGLAVEGSWPVWSWMIQKFGEGQIAKVAQNLYFKERGKLQDMVNNRVATSLITRDFSVFHDQSAGKMLEVINRGKEATVDLVATTYFDLVPMLARIGSYPFGQAFLGKFETLMAVAKLPILGVVGLRGAKEQQLQHAQELQLWDKINTELVTTLGNLETIRTAGRPEDEAALLKQALADRDFVASGGLRKKISREKTMSRVFDLMDVGIPGATHLRDFYKKIKSGISVQEAALTGYSIYQRANFAKSEQMMVRQAFNSVMQLYHERIIPDIQDIQRMEELLGPYDALDVPNGMKEQRRVGVDTLPSYDISIKNLGYKNILNEVSMDIPQGTFVAIKGPSGIGKTTLLRHLVGLYEADRGSMTVGGKPIGDIKKYGDQSLLSHIGYAGQSADLLEGWTLRENLLLGTSNVTEVATDNVLSDLGLDHLKDRLDTKLKHFSGGEKRRIGIARALLKNPNILILDEPTAHLDAKSTEQVMEIIQQLRKKRPEMTVMAITHDPVFENIAERVIDFAEVNNRAILEEEVMLKDHQVLEAIARPQK